MYIGHVERFGGDGVTARDLKGAGPVTF